MNKRYANFEDTIEAIQYDGKNSEEIAKLLKEYATVIVIGDHLMIKEGPYYYNGKLHWNNELEAFITDYIYLDNDGEVHVKCECDFKDIFMRVV